jgi:MazG family protein
VDLQPLADVIHTLRAPGGCPWDQAQTHHTLLPFLVEESAEVCDAVEGHAGDAALCEELGDVLLQVVLHAEIARERGAFDLQDVCDGITRKMVVRHPHVFAPDAAALGSPEEVTQRWEAAKQAGRDTPPSVLGRLPRHLPALQRADQLARRAARVHFDWPDVPSTLAKVHEELDEIAQVSNPPQADALHHEVGDLLLACANYARKLGVAPEAALRDACDRFVARFQWMERAAPAGGLASLDLDAQEELWQAAKKALAPDAAAEGRPVGEPGRVDAE